MKKTILKSLYIITVLFIFFAGVLSSCASTKKVESAAAESVTTDDKSLSKSEKRKAEKEAKKAEKEAQKKAKSNKSGKKTDDSGGVEETPSDIQDKKSSGKKLTEEEKCFVGWDYCGQNNVTVDSGNVTVKARGKNGSFNLYSKDFDGKGTPVLSSYDEFTRTSFYLKAGKRVFKLADGAGVKSSCGKTDNGVRIYYSIQNVAQVVVDLQIIKSEESRDADMVKISSSVKSLKKKKDEFGLKICMDTELGEKNIYHFYTSDGLPVKSELAFHTGTKPKWIQSGNELTSLQVLLSGADITEQDVISVASFSTINTLEWIPPVQSSRAFDNVLSYNNSAVGINWIPKMLEPGEEFFELFYMTFSTYPLSVNGEGFLKAYEQAHKKNDTPEVVSETLPPVTQVEPSVSEPVVQKTEVIIIREEPKTVPVEKKIPVQEETKTVQTSVEVVKEENQTLPQASVQEPVTPSTKKTPEPLWLPEQLRKKTTPVEEKTEPVPEIKTETAPEPLWLPEQLKKKTTPTEEKTEPVLEVKPEPVTEVKVQPVSEVVSEPVSDVLLDPVPEVKSEPVPEVKTNPIPELVAEPVSEVQLEPVPEIKKETVTEVKPVVNEKVEPVIEYVYEIMDYQLSPAYIQSLLDRIEELQSDESNLNKDELLRLSHELDEILKKLRN
ncbi:MAG: hypothetical protein HUK25_09020 [Treponema sp.]|nr:hypothetical protein [Treponema sp.]